MRKRENERVAQHLGRKELYIFSRARADYPADGVLCSQICVCRELIRRRSLAIHQCSGYTSPGELLVNKLSKIDFDAEPALINPVAAGEEEPFCRYAAGRDSRETFAAAWNIFYNLA
jgi:hypothetical protein